MTERANQAEKQLYSGAVSNPRELQALQDDVASIRRRIGQIEDHELEIMELSEPVDAEQATLTARARAARRRARSRSPATLAEAESAIAAELAEVRAERDDGGRRASRASCGASTTRCARSSAAWPSPAWSAVDVPGCHLRLSAVEVDRIRKLAADVLVHCEECGRLLVRD